jgi:hypothetical protein
MNKKIALILPILILLLPITAIPVNAKATQANLFTFHSGSVIPLAETVVGKIIFGNPVSAGEESAVEWMVTVILQEAAPNREYLVFVEKDYWSGVFISIGLMATDAFGCGSFHYNGQYGTAVASYLGIGGPGTYTLSICLNDVTGLTITNPVGITESPGVSVYLSAASPASWSGSQITLK